MNEKNEDYIYNQTLFFAESVARVIEDMIGESFLVMKDSYATQMAQEEATLKACLHFAGSVQGDFVLSLDEKMAAELCPIKAPAPDRRMYGDFVCEILNISSGQALENLGYPDLAVNTSVLIIGEILFPNVLCGTMKIAGTRCSINCSFLLNTVQLMIHNKLSDALSKLDLKTREAAEARKNIQSILKFFPDGIVTINRNEYILPGYSHATTAIMGLPRDLDIAYSPFSRIIGLAEQLQPDWLEWLAMVFSDYNTQPFNFLVGQCPISEFKNIRGKRLALSWYPITCNDEQVLEKLMVVIEEK